MYIKVRVKAGAREESLVEVAPNSLRIALREKAEKNAANRRVAQLVARHFKVPTKSIRLIRGHKMPSKMLEIR